jgi:hypothetical protein
MNHTGAGTHSVAPRCTIFPKCRPTAVLMPAHLRHCFRPRPGCRPIPDPRSPAEQMMFRNGRFRPIFSGVALRRQPLDICRFHQPTGKIRNEDRMVLIPRDETGDLKLRICGCDQSPLAVFPFSAPSSPLSSALFSVEIRASWPAGTRDRFSRGACPTHTG